MDFRFPVVIQKEVFKVQVIGKFLESIIYGPPHLPVKNGWKCNHTRYNERYVQER